MYDELGKVSYIMHDGEIYLLLDHGLIDVAIFAIQLSFELIHETLAFAVNLWAPRTNKPNVLNSP